MILPVFTGTENEVLRQKSLPVQKTSKKTLRLIKNMIETMHSLHGLGISAPQVGINERILVANLQYGENVGDKNVVVAMINPVIINHSQEEEMGDEGCLSLPEVFAEVKRYSSITVQYIDGKGRNKVMELHGLNARIVQHEIDHLDGKLFVDYVDEAVLGKYEKELARAAL